MCPSSMGNDRWWALQHISYLSCPMVVQARLYSMHGQALPRQFSLGAEAAREGVTDAVIYGDGLVALTGGDTPIRSSSCLMDAHPAKQGSEITDADIYGTASWRSRVGTHRCRERLYHVCHGRTPCQADSKQNVTRHVMSSMARPACGASRNSLRATGWLG